jgi:uracil-DNA glycosylase
LVHPQKANYACLLPLSNHIRRQSAYRRSTGERCELYKNATQTVFGERRSGARVVLVGEQPGDREDIAGMPFVGPAGRLLDECLNEASIDRSLCYVTNAVKHFKFERRGKRLLSVTSCNNNFSFDFFRHRESSENTCGAIHDGAA